ncbi:MAG: AbrB/MazE/SpoVT family DNA-binding domain-containing protein [Candidatus Baldrarchaeota archaeon]
MIALISEIIVKVGKKGEIYFPIKFRKMVGLRPGDRVRVRVEGDKIILEKEKDVEDLLGDYVLKVSVEEVEKISEEIQKEAGIID